MYAQKLLVHNRSQRQGAERLHTRVVDLLGIFVLAFEFESEVIRQMATFVVAS
jgi:predicted nucleic acid-binding protein